MDKTLALIEAVTLVKEARLLVAASYHMWLKLNRIYNYLDAQVAAAMKEEAN